MVHAVAGDCPQLREVIYIGTPGWDELVAGGAGVHASDLTNREAELAFDDPINIQYTSGTTGFPKGATLSHHNILNNGYFVARGQLWTEHDRVVVPVPFYHCFGTAMGNLGARQRRRLHRHSRTWFRAGWDAAGGRRREGHRALRRAHHVHRRAGRSVVHRT